MGLSSYNGSLVASPVGAFVEVLFAMPALPPSRLPSSHVSAIAESAGDTQPASSALKARLHDTEELTIEFADDESELKPENEAAQGESSATEVPESAEAHAAQAATEFDAKALLQTVPNRPGCYRMYNDRDVVIYVGKAKDLKRRLSSYFLKRPVRSRATVNQCPAILTP